jgi:hypothetical protein
MTRMYVADVLVSRDRCGGPLDPYIDGFGALLHECGYASLTPRGSFALSSTSAAGLVGGGSTSTISTKSRSGGSFEIDIGEGTFTAVTDQHSAGCSDICSSLA